LLFYFFILCGMLAGVVSLNLQGDLLAKD
jgi:hypothetical protein